MNIERQALWWFRFNVWFNTVALALHFAAGNILWALFHTTLALFAFASRANMLLTAEFVARAKTRTPEEFLRSHMLYSHLVFKRPFGALRLFLHKRWRGEPWP